MTLQQVLDRIRMEGLSHAVSKDREVVTVLVDEHRADYFVFDRVAIVQGYPLPQSFDSMLDHMSRRRTKSLNVVSPPNSIHTA